MHRLLRPILLALSLCLAALGLAEPEITIRMMGGPSYGIPPKEGLTTTAIVRRAVFDEFHRQNPDIRVVNAGGLNLVADMADNIFLMSMAGDDSPDVFYVNFRQYYTFLDQHFCRPLDDLIAATPGALDRVNPTVLKVIKSYDGHIYAMPFYQVALGLYYRKDHFVEAGLDPARPPKDWDEFFDYSKKLTMTQAGRYGFEVSDPPGYLWSNFFYQAGAEVVTQDQFGKWHSAIATPEAAKAVEFFRKFALTKWKGEDGKEYGPALGISTNVDEDIRSGKCSMWFYYTNDVLMNGNSAAPPSVVGIAAMPAGPAGYKNEINAGMWAISSKVKDPKKLAACWRFIQYFSGTEAARVNAAKCVEMGLGNLVNPIWLKRFGYTDVLSQVDPSYIRANEQLFQTGHPEPYGRNCQQVYNQLDDVLARARLNPSMPAMEILKIGEREMNDKLIGYTPEPIMQQRRAWAWGIFGCLVAAVCFWLYRCYRSYKANKSNNSETERLPAGVPRGRIYRFIAICIAPAALSILTWAYYPLARGLIIAFQDYKVFLPPKWVGLDNFIGVFSQPVFYQAILNSFAFVTLSLAIGFVLPIALALALNEIPFGKVFFRTVYYLPAMTSAIVVSFLWRQIYDKQPTGLLNSLCAPLIEHLINPVRSFLHMAPWPTANDWLGTPTLAMFAVVLPGIWAGAGPGSILYLAALKNISQDRYEAADIDGANWWQKIRYITLPGLKPLILINLLGVFIAGFKAMENIFVLTQGGPVNTTRTIGLEVWQNAFMYLKFGYATAAAWVMGAILVGFTLIQIKSLLRMRFSTAPS